MTLKINYLDNKKGSIKNKAIFVPLDTKISAFKGNFDRGNRACGYNTPMFFEARNRFHTLSKPSGPLLAQLGPRPSFPSGQC